MYGRKSLIITVKCFLLTTSWVIQEVANLAMESKEYTEFAFMDPHSVLDDSSMHGAVTDAVRC